VEIALAIVVIVALALFVAAPLWRARTAGGGGDDPVIADLEARKEAKYREIRDAELDHAQGKLSDADWARADAQLRREAVEILKALDEARRGRVIRAQAGTRTRDNDSSGG
jgi:hypothetical protein